METAPFLQHGVSSGSPKPRTKPARVHLIGTYLCWLRGRSWRFIHDHSSSYTIRALSCGRTHRTSPSHMNMYPSFPTLQRRSTIPGKPWRLLDRKLRGTPLGCLHGVVSATPRFRRPCPCPSWLRGLVSGNRVMGFLGCFGSPSANKKGAASLAETHCHLAKGSNYRFNRRLNSINVTQTLVVLCWICVPVLYVRTTVPTLGLTE